MNVESRIHDLVESLLYQDKCRILENLIWDLFGDLDENGEGVLVPGRVPDQAAVASVITSLRQEFWPDQFPAAGEVKNKQAASAEDK